MTTSITMPTDPTPSDHVANTALVGPIFLNRELSQLAFNRRVLAQAEDKDIPLLERLRYLCIASSNLDEFFEVRIASLLAKSRLDGDTREPAALTAALQLTSTECHAIVERQYQVLNREVLPQLSAQGIHLLRDQDRNDRQRAWVKEYFDREVRPLLTPIGLDPNDHNVLFYGGELLVNGATLCVSIERVSFNQEMFCLYVHAEPH